MCRIKNVLDIEVSFRNSLNFMVTRKKTAVHLLIITIIVFGFSWYFMSSLTFFSNDNGLRFIQIQELIRNQGQSFSVSYPARTIDPTLDYTPFYYAYSLIGEEIFLQISAFLPLITAWLYPFLGTFALPVVPVTGGVLTATAVFYLGKLAEVKRPYLLLWATLFATPLLFYSMELWDHTIAVACALWSTVGLAYGLQKGRWQFTFLGGMALGIGLGQRPEIYVYAIALGATALILEWRKWHIWGALIVGALLTAVPIWYLHWQWVGHPLGMAVASNLLNYGVPETYAFTTTGYPRHVTLSWFILYVQGRDPYIFLAALLILTGIFFTIFSLRIPHWQKPWLLWLAFATVCAGSFLMLWQTYGEVIPGILSTFPLAALALVFIDKKQDSTAQRTVYLLCFSTALIFWGIMIAVWPASGGTQWGTRYLLPVYPLFVFLAFYVYTIQNRLLTGSYLFTFQRVATGILIVSILIQGYSISLLYNSHKQGNGLRDAVDNLSAELIFTNNPFLPSFMASLDKQFLYIDDTEDLNVLIPRLWTAGIDHFAIITGEGMPISVPTQVENIDVIQTDTIIYTLVQQPESGEQNE